MNVRLLVLSSPLLFIYPWGSAPGSGTTHRPPTIPTNLTTDHPDRDSPSLRLSPGGSRLYQGDEIIHNRSRILCGGGQPYRSTRTQRLSVGLVTCCMHSNLWARSSPQPMSLTLRKSWRLLFRMAEMVFLAQGPI